MSLLANLLIRPERAVYDTQDMGCKLFFLEGEQYFRRDLSLVNERGYRLACSWFIREYDDHPSPCLVYCHGNCGSRMDAYDVVEEGLRLGMSIFTFDFAGSGHSEGEYVSMGLNESMDIKVVVEYLQCSQAQVSHVVLWGRSMGSVACLRYIARFGGVSCVVLDSPFASLERICVEISSSHKFLPDCMRLYAVTMMLRSAAKKLGVDFGQLNPLLDAKHCSIPAFFIHGINDTLINPSHMREIFEAYTGTPKIKHEVIGRHNSFRPDWIIEEGLTFITRCLNLDHQGETGSKRPPRKLADMLEQAEELTATEV